MNRVLCAVRILIPLLGFHLAALALVLGLACLDLTFALQRHTWIPNVGLIRIDIFIVILTAALVRVAPRAAEHTPTSCQEAAREQHPELWLHITRLSARASIPLPDKILLGGDPIIEVTQDARWLWLKPGPRILLLGAELLTPIVSPDLDAAIVRALYCTATNPRVPLAPLLTRSRAGITRSVVTPTASGKGIAHESATALRTWHGRNYLRVTRTLAEQLYQDAEQKRAEMGL